MAGFETRPLRKLLSGQGMSQHLKMLPAINIRRHVLSMKTAATIAAAQTEYVMHKSFTGGK